MIVTSVNEINFSALSKSGKECFLFDKDNTLTGHKENKFFNAEIEETIKSV
jgi:predicted HAD superfamily phosphohydrolase YqeG